MEFWQWATVALVLALLLMAGGLFAIAAAIDKWTAAWLDEPDPGKEVTNHD